MTYSSLISIDNLFQAWEEFKKGKRKKRDVQVFERHLEDNLFDLYRKLKSKTYRHGPYTDFYLHDPKTRHIHKAGVYDRIVHHLLYKYLYGIFDKTFIFDSYSCRINKGTHRAVRRLEKFTRIVGQNYTQSCWALKLDIRQFFASVNHRILLELITRKVTDKDILWLINEVLISFCSCHPELVSGSDSGQARLVSDESERAGMTKEMPNQIRHDITRNGIPLGNLTSQVFANVYLNELDQFVKHGLGVKYYLRYADDFIILEHDPDLMYQYIDTLGQFLQNRLKLQLHPKKIILRKLIRGIDFCGYVVLPHYRLVRIKTKRRIFNNFPKEFSAQSLQSYLGYFSHANSYHLSLEFINRYSSHFFRHF